MESYNEVFAMTFCTWHDSGAVVACAKFCSKMMAFHGVTPKPIWHRIWVTMEKSFVKWAPDRHCSLKGDRVALLGQKWHTGYPDLGTDAKDAVKFWTCSEQVVQRLLKLGRHVHCRGCRMDAKWLVNGRHVINVFCCKADPSIWAMLMPSL